MSRLAPFQKVGKEPEFSSNWSIVQYSVLRGSYERGLRAFQIPKYISTKPTAASGASLSFDFSV
jgi:hypothetical protein